MRNLPYRLPTCPLHTSPVGRGEMGELGEETGGEMAPSGSANAVEGGEEGDKGEEGGEEAGEEGGEEGEEGDDPAAKRMKPRA